ncbi:Maph90 [Matsumuraeses phaseoli granulovirus]|uniref:Maph90 n=1 Tax=Matsumuraeses phaseoli granulovirus TaxID=2760664 RepID=A0AAE7MLE6_9BBAC|nr:Maph90 [Matsumuraeses phaseoli granulovirus]QOD40053.1 Maph90 [Matsumuraeses phaseoli granulovirus]
MNNQFYEHKYVPDGAHRHYDIEKVQKEILQQHKYLETQMNQLKDNIQRVCSSNGIVCSGDNSFTTGYNPYFGYNSSPVVTTNTTTFKSRHDANLTPYSNMEVFRSGIRKF